MTGLTKNEFISVLNEVPPIENELEGKASDALFIYLMKLRTGRPISDIASHCYDNRAAKN